MALPRVSILIPTHNRPKTLLLAIESALAQTLPDFELLVVGDGCTDATADAVASVGDDRIRWLDFPKAPGFGYATRNAALREARGELIAYLADDDLWLHDHLELLVGHLRGTDAELGYSRPLDVTGDGHIMPQVFNLDDPRTLGRWVERQLGYLSISSVVHQRSCLDRYGMWNEQMVRGADWDLWMRIIRGGQGRAVAYLPTPTAFHFLASWRSEPWFKRVLVRARRWEGAVLPELRVVVEGGATQQETVWRRIAGDPVRAARELRRAVQIDLDRRATLDSIVPGLFDLAKRHLKRAPRRR